MTHNAPTGLRAAGLAVVARAAEVVADHARRSSTARDRHHALERECEELIRTVERLTRGRERVLEAVVGQLDALIHGEQPPPWPDITDEVDPDPTSAAVVRRVERLHDREAGIVGAFVSLAQRWQTTAHEMEFLARRTMERYPDDEDALRDYFRISHAAATQARSAQTLTLLAGRWPGRQWPQPQPLATIVQHASARIVDYPRVQVANQPDVAVISSVVEPLVHLIAELLANATRSSPPSTQVTVTFDEVDTGWAITVHDDGHGLDAERLAWAQDRVSGRVRVGLHELGEPPQTGLAVVGELALRHQFLVRLDSTANGGVRAVTTVPHHMLVKVSAGADLPVAPAPRQPPRTPPPPPAPSGRHRDLADRLAPAEPAGGTTARGLPIRVPQRQDPPAPPRTPALPVPAPDPDPDAAGEFMATFVQGSLPPPGPDTDGDAKATTDSEEQP